MPNFPIVDTQVHLWDPQRFRMRGIEGNDILDQRYELDDYYEHTRGVEIEAMVYMEVAPEPNYELLEAQWANAQAEREPRLGRQAHLTGKVAQALVAKAPELFSKPLQIEKVDVLAAKLPG